MKTFVTSVVGNCPADRSTLTHLSLAWEQTVVQAEADPRSLPEALQARRGPSLGLDDLRLFIGAENRVIFCTVR